MIQPMAGPPINSGSNQMPSVQHNHPGNRNSMPTPYGWDQSLSQLSGAGAGHGSISMPTTPVMPPYQASGGQFAGFNVGGQFPPQNPNFFAKAPYQSGHDSTNVISNSKMLPDATDASGPSSEGFNLVPNLDFEAWGDSDAFFNQQEGSQNGAPCDNSYKTHQRKSSDLIQLGFESILTSEEKEYFSLEYFDPLHRKGRTMSMSVSSPTSSVSNYFFAKPPEDADVVSVDRNAWVTFDDDGVFVKESSEDVADKVTVAVDKVHDKPTVPALDDKVKYNFLHVPSKHGLPPSICNLPNVLFLKVQYILLQNLLMWPACKNLVVMLKFSQKEMDSFL